MADIYFGLIAMLGLGLAAFVVTARLVRHAPRWLDDALALVTVAILCAYIRWLWDDVSIARYLPVSNLIIVGNWFLPLLGILAGLVSRRIRDSARRRWIATLLLFGVGFYATIRPVFGEAPSCKNHWFGTLCMQTTDATCSPAAAATLLRYRHIVAQEQEMADLCLTRAGTTWKGLYRGLTLKTAGTPWRVEATSVRRGQLPDLSRGPMLARIELAPNARCDPRYESEEGWVRGVSHSVLVIVVLPEGHYLVHDPATGLETWKPEDVKLLWTGDALQLVSRDESGAPGLRVALGAN